MTVWSARNEPLLQLSGLTVAYERRGAARPLVAVDDVDLTVGSGETVGLVGESGSGKSTIGRAILGLVPVDSGAILFRGEDITRASRQRRRQLAADLQVVFQDPYSSLNPTRTVGDTLSEMLHPTDTPRREVRQRVAEMLDQVGLPQDAAIKYPSEFSGGQRQRIAIARALMRRPRLIICDEPVSALDLSVQAQILNLLRDIQNSLGVSYLFIAHDLPVVRHLSDRIVVLYGGQVMEVGDAPTVYSRPTHPYTRALLAAVPIPDPTARRMREAHSRGSSPSSSAAPTSGCPFVPRCALATAHCTTVRPALEPTETGARVACHHWRDGNFTDGAAAGQELRRPDPDAC